MVTFQIVAFKHINAEDQIQSISQYFVPSVFCELVLTWHPHGHWLDSTMCEYDMDEQYWDICAIDLGSNAAAENMEREIAVCDQQVLCEASESQ